MDINTVNSYYSVEYDSYLKTYIVQYEGDELVFDTREDGQTFINSLIES